MTLNKGVTYTLPGSTRFFFFSFKESKKSEKKPVCINARFDAGFGHRLSNITCLGKNK